MRSPATVARISIAPVKSMALSHPSTVRLEDHGVRGDRLYFVVDGDGRLLTGSGFGPLVRVRPEVGDDHLALTLPDGSRIDGPTSRGGESLEVVFHGRPVAARTVPGPWDEALSAMIGGPVRLAAPQRPGDARDDEPATLVSLASIEAIGAEAGVGPSLDARRFRMTFDVTGLDAFEEDGWIGRSVRVGEAIVRIGEPVPRCVVTTQHPETGEVDAKVLDAIERLRGRTPRGKLPLGVYASVERPGRVNVGDVVTPI